ncbi:universal stress protein [Novipirellula artificiosorum]|uniref:Universal stress protein E n=1 Tax=Novipirellula artificiosorum TaxID=2528016 RepID=A0A5C6DZA3_9BACT|nr:universal stress protein [Novipirellula artificiosorum]TWU41958.1 Universal stress protein E [Novipirellula artificiosorum]
MKRFQKILVATDTRFDNQAMVDEAVQLARGNGASLKIVDVMPELPWTVRLTMKDHEHVSELMRDEKQQMLEALAVPIREKGVDVEVKVLQGKTSVEIIREVLRGQHDLVIRSVKGVQSRRAGFFGTTGLRLLRKCPCPVWLVKPGITKFHHILGCVDTSSADPIDAELNGDVFDLARSISQYHSGTFTIIHAWTVWNAQFLKRRMDPTEFENMVNGHRNQVTGQLEKFLAGHNTPVGADDVQLIQGEAPDVIPEFARKNHVDLIVMGTVARSGVSGMVMGNTAEQILGRIECSVLALKPSTFGCPIVLDD